MAAVLWVFGRNDRELHPLKWVSGDRPRTSVKIALQKPTGLSFRRVWKSAVSDTFLPIPDGNRTRIVPSAEIRQMLP